MGKKVANKSPVKLNSNVVHVTVTDSDSDIMVTSEVEGKENKQEVDVVSVSSGGVCFSESDEKKEKGKSDAASEISVDGASEKTESKIKSDAASVSSGASISATLKSLKEW